MNLDNLISAFIKEIDVKEVHQENISPLRKTYDISFSVNDWKVLLSKAIDISVMSNPPKGLTILNGDKNNIKLTDDQKQSYADRVVSEQYKYWEALRATVLDDLYKKVAKNLTQESTKPKFSLQSENENNINYKMEIDILDDLKDIDFPSLVCENYQCNVTDGDVEKEILQFLDKQIKEIKSSDSNRIATAGDIVEINFVGKLGNIAFEGGSAKNFKFEVGNKSMLSDFEEGVLGMKVGEEKSVKVKFPKDYQEKNLAGLEAIFKIDLTSIFDKGKYNNVPEFFELNKDTHGFQDFESFRKAVKQNVEFNTNYILWILKKDNFLDKLDSVLNFDLPQLIVENEFSQAKMRYMQKKAHEMQSKASENEKNKTPLMPDEIEKDLKDLERTVQTKIKISMFLNDVARKNKIDLSQEDIDAQSIEQATLRNMDKESFIRKYCNNENFVNSLRANAFEEKILKFIIGKASSNNIDLTRDEAKNRYEKIFIESN